MQNKEKNYNYNSPKTSPYLEYKKEITQT